MIFDMVQLTFRGEPGTHLTLNDRLLCPIDPRGRDIKKVDKAIFSTHGIRKNSPRPTCNDCLKRARKIAGAIANHEPIATIRGKFTPDSSVLRNKLGDTIRLIGEPGYLTSDELFEAGYGACYRCGYRMPLEKKVLWKHGVPFDIIPDCTNCGIQLLVVRYSHYTIDPKKIIVQEYLTR